MIPRYARYLIALGLIGSAAPARAQETADRVVLHGFGSWTFGRTTWNNHYLPCPITNARHGACLIAAPPPSPPASRE